MRGRIVLSLTIIAVLVMAVTVSADKPVHPGNPPIPFGNGFPSGPHYNLNLIAKQAHFAWPCEATGNVIFIPRVQGDDDITIPMESGKRAPKHQQDVTSMEVADWCTESFADCPGGQLDGAAFNLPQSDAGYGVYLTVTGKPNEVLAPTVTISPSLEYVRDEYGNDLLLLGLVDPNKVAT